MSINETRSSSPVRTRSSSGTSRQRRRSTQIFLLVAALIVITLLALLGYQWVYADRIYEGVNVFGTDISGMTRDEATTALSKKFDTYLTQPLTFRYGDRQWTTTLSQVGLQIDPQKTIDSAFTYGRSGSPFDRLRTQIDSHTSKPTAIKPTLSVDEARRADFFNQLSKQIDQPIQDAAITVDTDRLKVVLTPSSQGQQLDIAKSIQVLEQAIQNQSSTNIDLVVQKTEPSIVKSDLETAQVQAEKIISNALNLTFEDANWKLEPKQLAQMVIFNNPSTGTSKVEASLSDDLLKTYFEGLANKIDRPAVSARFNLDRSTKQLSVLKNSVNGTKLDVDAATNAVKEQTLTDNRQISLPVTIINPPIKAEDIDSLVINDLIEEDSTSYAGSISARAHNVELATTRLNGVVVGPGQTFSFNDEVGRVTLATGYQIGYGITVSEGEMITVPSEGGGICQVVSTLFHPVFWAGYPITERYGHLYWIPKYGQPPKGMQGLDATVDTIYDKNGKLSYSVDFKFKNTTENAILIQSYTANSKVYFSLWGVKPNWQVKVEGPVIEDIVKANTEQVKQNDPTMDVGKTLWVEEARDGFKSTITRTVTQDGKMINYQQIITRYNPSRNVLLVGTKGASSTSTEGISTPTATKAPSSTKTPTPTATKSAAPTPTKTR